MKIDQRNAESIYNEVKTFMFDKKVKIEFKYEKVELTLPISSTNNAKDSYYNEHGYAEVKNGDKTYIIQIMKKYQKDNAICTNIYPDLKVELFSEFNGELFPIWEMNTKHCGISFYGDASTSDFPFHFLKEDETQNTSSDDEINYIY